MIICPFLFPPRDSIIHLHIGVLLNENCKYFNIIDMVGVPNQKIELSGHVARMEEGGGSFWLGDLREGCHLEDPSVDGRVILNCIFEKWDRRSWTGLIWFRLETGGGQL